MRAEEALQAAAADELAGKVQEAAAAIEQAGRGIAKVFSQLAAGVPHGNELYYLAAVQGYINEAMMRLIEVATPPATPENQAPSIVLG